MMSLELWQVSNSLVRLFIIKHVPQFINDLTAIFSCTCVSMNKCTNTTEVFFHEFSQMKKNSPDRGVNQITERNDNYQEA